MIRKNLTKSKVVKRAMTMGLAAMMALTPITVSAEEIPDAGNNSSNDNHLGGSSDSSGKSETKNAAQVEEAYEKEVNEATPSDDKAIGDPTTTTDTDKIITEQKYSETTTTADSETIVETTVKTVNTEKTEDNTLTTTEKTTVDTTTTTTTNETISEAVAPSPEEKTVSYTTSNEQEYKEKLNEVLSDVSGITGKETKTNEDVLDAAGNKIGVKNIVVTVYTWTDASGKNYTKTVKTSEIVYNKDTSETSTPEAFSPAKPIIINGVTNNEGVSKDVTYSNVTNPDGSITSTTTTTNALAYTTGKYLIESSEVVETDKKTVETEVETVVETVVKIYSEEKKTITDEAYAALTDEEKANYIANVEGTGYVEVKGTVVEAPTLASLGIDEKTATVEAIKNAFNANDTLKFFTDSVSADGKTITFTRVAEDNTVTTYTYTVETKEEKETKSTPNVIESIIGKDAVNGIVPEINASNYEKYTVIAAGNVVNNCHQNGGIYAGGEISGYGWIDSWAGADIYAKNSKTTPYTVTERVATNSTVTSSENIQSYWATVASNIMEATTSTSDVTEVKNEQGTISAIIANYDSWKATKKDNNGLYDYIKTLIASGYVKSGNDNNFQPGQDAQGQYGSSNLVIVTESKDNLTIKNWSGNLSLGMVIAPNAKIIIESNNVTGTIIAKTIETAAEGHINKVSGDSTVARTIATVTSTGKSQEILTEQVSHDQKSTVTTDEYFGYTESIKKTTNVETIREIIGLTKQIRTTSVTIPALQLNDPIVPNKPKDPVNPYNPVNPIDPVKPGNPSDPVIPSDPEAPVNPIAPQNPAVIGTPVYIITEDDVPLADVPSELTTIDEDDVPLITIIDEDVPLAFMDPTSAKTGESEIPFLLFGSAFTVLGISALTYVAFKKREEA